MSASRSDGFKRCLCFAMGICGAAIAGPAEAYLASDFFPLSDGASWTYQVNGVEGYTRTVAAGTMAINGIETKAILYSEGSALYLTNDVNGVKQYRSVTAQETDTFSPPVVLASATPAIGQSVSSSGTLTAINPSLAPVPITLAYSASSTVSGPEFVTVPAGRFAAIRITTSISASGTVSGMYASLSTSIESWVVRSIGVVKQIQTVTTPAGAATTMALLTATNLPIPAPLVPISRHAVAAGSTHSLALKQDGTVWAWGGNTYGQLGDGSTVSRNTPVQVSGLSGIVAIAGGDRHSLALKSDGTVWAWGNNSWGELGDGTTTNRLTPVQASGLGTVTAIAAGGGHSLALGSDGTIWAWGRGNVGQLGNGATANSANPVKVSALSGVISVGAGFNHSLALKQDGTVWTWGSNLMGQLGGYSSDKSTPIEVQNVGAAIAISAGLHHSLALIGDGSVLAWGSNAAGQLGVSGGFPSSPIAMEGMNASIAAVGAFHNLAIGQDGTLWSWGSNYWGELGRATATYTRVPPGQVGALSGVVAVAAGTDISTSTPPGHSLAVTADGAVWAWGNNWNGELGDGTWSNRSTPVPVAGPDGSGTFSLAASNAWWLVPGWNLLGNGASGALDVASAFGDAAKVTTVWKWVPGAMKWAFYTPSLGAAELSAYAAGKGYDVLTAVNGGEGFWVNAKSAFGVPLPGGTPVASASFQSMGSGWNLIAIGDNLTPPQFNAAIGAASPLNTIWSWAAVQNRWYFYAPSLEAQGASVLMNYIAGKGYLDFAGNRKTLDSRTGFWLNKP